MTVYLAPDPIQSTQLIPGGNVPASGGLLFVYQAGTSTKQNSYTDSSASTARTNPIVLDSGGNIPGNGEVWIASTAKFVFAPSTDTDPPGSPYWTRDYYPGINNIVSQLATAEWVDSTLTPTFINASTFSFSGDQTVIFDENRRLKTINTAGTIYGYIQASAFSSGSTTIAVVNDSGSLDSGLSTISYGLLSPNNESVPQNLSRNVISVKDYGAVGDGVTNDTAAIQAAFNITGEIYFPSGNTYLFNSANLTLSSNTTLHIPRGATLKGDGRRLSAIGVNNISIIGGGLLEFVNMPASGTAPNADWEVDGRGAIEFGNTAASPATNFSIIGMEVISDWSGTPSGGGTPKPRRGIYIQCARQVRVIGNRVRGFEGESIIAGGAGTRDVVFSNNTVHDSNHDGLNFQGPSGINGVISGNTVYNVLNGIEAAVGVISNNTIDSPTGSGIAFGSGGGGPITVRGNYIRNVGTIGIDATFSPTAGPVEISGNVINDSDDEAIRVNTVTDLRLTNNTITQAGTGAATVAAISMAAVTRGYVADNVIANPSANCTQAISVSGGGNTGLVFGWNGAIGSYSSGAFAGFTNAGPTDTLKPIRAATAANSVTGTVNETTLRTTTIAANSLGTTGGIHIVAHGTITGVNNTKTIRFKWAGGTQSTITEAAAETDAWSFEAWISAREVTNSQNVHIIARQGTAVEEHISTTAGGDTSTSVAIAITGQLVNGADTITCLGFYAEQVLGVPI